MGQAGFNERMLDKIGTTAGKIWNYLNENRYNQTVTLDILSDSIQEDKDIILLAIGWLARENKLFFEDCSGDICIHLRD